LHITKARAAQADAWIAFGEVRDAAEMIKSFKRLGYAPRMFFARSASDPKLIPFVGQDAEFALGALAYDGRLATPENERFVKAYTAKWSATPTLAAAQGYAAGTVVGEGVRRAGSAEQDKLRAALASEAIPTVLGLYKVDPKTGEQTAAVPAITQVQTGRPEVVWPRALETRKPVLPYPQWHERRLLKSTRGH
jgi:branched-chain amino acid transport system substrate-binding protein